MSHTKTKHTKNESHDHKAQKHHAKKKHPQGGVLNRFTTKLLKDIKNADLSLRISHRTLLILLVITATFLTGYLKIAELNSREMVKIKINLLEMASDADMYHAPVV
ncbi:MAG: hypothetical protein H6767_01220 [Candidatus Peribacteria bacterium]|nr:MAG: hypothetical protein H6767_01220 [Candidatus Peribacteria bacterium]